MASDRLFLSHLALALATLAAAEMPPEPQSDSGAAFTAGLLGESGQNLYVNRRGELEVIRRYDLDGNGHLDLLFNSTHDSFHALPATLATWRKGRPEIELLPVEGSSRVLGADLNRDGWNDLVFMPNRQNVQRQRGSLAIAWGGADGWSAQRLTRQLPVHGVTSIGSADVDEDGWPDLLALNDTGWLFGQPAGRILRVYWGGADGFVLTRYYDLGIPAAVEMVTGRFGPEGRWRVAVLAAPAEVHFIGVAAEGRRLAVATTRPLGAASDEQVRTVAAAPGERADLLWFGTGRDRLLRMDTADLSVTTQPGAPATHVAVGRLDDDAWPDLVLTEQRLVFPSSEPETNRAPSLRIAWGGPEGTVASLTPLDVPNACASAVDDVDGDGKGDLLVSVHQGATSMVADSLVYLGDGARRFARPPQTVTTEGAQGVAVVRTRPTEPPVAIFTHSQRRTLDDAVPIRMYWGAPDGFARERFVDIPNLSGYKSSASDLNSDGHVDLIVINGGDISEEAGARAAHAGINIYWGGATGDLASPGPTKFDTTRRQVLREKRIGSINVADLDRDGYLDLVLGAFDAPGGANTQLVLYYGSAEGFTPTRRTAIDMVGRSIGCLVADFNRDGDLDIVVGAFRQDQVITFWGRQGRYSGENRTVLTSAAPIDLEAADFNGDGWLDLVVASYYDSVAQHHDTGSTIFWGGAAGWSQACAQSLPGITPLGLAVADLDGDGHLDLVSPHYHSELTRERLPSYIFWGGKDGFEARRRTSLIIDSASEAVIADFDRDGRLDLAFAAHSLDPGHVLESPVFYNDGRRFAAPRVQHLPAVGPHYMWVQDIGHIAHRRHEETFISRAHLWDREVRTARITVDADLPHQSRVAVQVRSAADAAGLGTAPWRDLVDGRIDLGSEARALHYRLVLFSANGDAYPRVRRVDVHLD